MKLTEYKWLTDLAADLPADLREALEELGVVTLEDFAVLMQIDGTNRAFVESVSSLTKGKYGEDSLVKYATRVNVSVLQELLKIPEDIRNEMDRGEIFQYGYLIGHAEENRYSEENNAIYEQTLNSFPDLAARLESLPSHTDHREQLPPIRDQGSRGTCVAFAATALREFFEGVHSGFSENYLYWGCKQIDGIKNQSGTYIKCSVEWITGDVSPDHEDDAGICLEKYWPYEKQKGENETNGDPSNEARADAPRHRGKSFVGYLSSDVNGIKAALAGIHDGEGGSPLTFGIPVFNSWYRNPVTIQTGRIPMPLPNETWIGGHAMLLTGYVDDGRFPGGGVFIFRNSWSERWASETIELSESGGQTIEVPAGYGILPYAFIEKYGRDFYTLEVEKSSAFHKRISRIFRYSLVFFIILCFLFAAFHIFRGSKIAEKTPAFVEAVQRVIFNIQKPVEDFFIPTIPSTPEEVQKHFFLYREFNYKYLAWRHAAHINSKSETNIPLQMTEHKYRWAVFVLYGDEAQLAQYMEEIERITGCKSERYRKHRLNAKSGS